jgi:hypothetical protein
VRYFNTAGPCDPRVHYTLPPEPRLPEARELIELGQYFVVHAPRQTGKTTSLNALASDLMAVGQLAALRISLQRAEPYGEDIYAVGTEFLAAIEDAAVILPPELRPPARWPLAPEGSQVIRSLSAWAEQCPRPLVLFLDEIDALRGEGLVSVLRQLRDGAELHRTGKPFPHSVVLCGMRDVRDYKIASGGDPARLGSASPFNIKVASLRLGDFTEADVAALYWQHTAETGQVFTPDAIEQAFAYTQGQPWLVNSLARVITRQLAPDPATPVTAEHVDEAKERLIRARETHLDSLVARLQEPRVRRIIEPLILGTFPETDPCYDDDVSYARDLGLIRQAAPLAVANPIYREIILRVLSQQSSDRVTADPRGFVLPDGRIDMA